MDSSGNFTMAQNLTVTGDLTVSGTTTTINSTTNSMSGGLDITIADTVNDIPLVIAQNDTTNNPYMATFTNA